MAGPDDDARQRPAARYSNQYHAASPEHCEVQATVDENRTTVKLSLTTDGYSKERPKTLRVKDGETAVVDITFQNDRANNGKSPASGKKVVIMMITPQIVVQVEEEDRLDVRSPPAKAGTKTGKEKTLIPAGAAAVPASQNILKNSGVEAGGKTPDHWEQGGGDGRRDVLLVQVRRFRGQSEPVHRENGGALISHRAMVADHRAAGRPTGLAGLRPGQGRKDDQGRLGAIPFCGHGWWQSRGTT